MKMTITDILSIIKPLDVASIFNSLVIAIIGIVFVYKNSKSNAASEMHIEKKHELYSKYLDLYADMLKSDMKQECREKAIGDVTKTQPSIILYSSPAVILYIKKFWDCVYQVGKYNTAENTINKTTAAALGDLVKAMREDLMLSNKDIKSELLGRVLANAMNDDEWKQ